MFINIDCKNKKYNVFEIIILTLILIVNNRYMYMISLGNNMHINIIVLLILILLIFTIHIKVKYMFISELMILYLLIIYTSLLSIFFLGQSTRHIIDANRGMLYYFLYFPLVYISKKYIKRKIIRDILKFLGLLYAVMIIIQFFLYPSIFFMKGVNFAYRLDGYRFFGGFPIVISSFFILADELFSVNGWKSKLFTVISLMVEYYYILAITKTRNVFLAVTFAFIILLIIQKRYRGYGKLVLIIGFLLIGYIFFKDYLVNLVELSLNDTTGTGEDRMIYINYVLDNIKNSYYMGFGLTSPQFQAVTYHIHDDIGIFGYFFEFGILGLIWAAYMIGKFTLMTFRIYKIKPEKSYYFIIYIVYTVIIMPFNCVFNVNELIIFFIISLALLENEYKDLLNLGGDLVIE